MKPMNDKHLGVLRRHMVELIEIHADLLEEEFGKGALDNRVLSAMLNVPRHLFVPTPIAHLAYEDRPLPIGFGKTISQPFICALMIDLLSPQRGDAVLEIGTGLGYHTAILAELVNYVWTVEIVEEFAEAARVRLSQLKYTNLDVRVGDGSRGWAEHPPSTKLSSQRQHRKCPENCSNNSNQPDAWSCRWGRMIGNNSLLSARA